MTYFKAEFDKVKAIKDRTVSRDGRVSGLSKYRGQNIKVVVCEDIECDDPPWREQHPYQVELDAHTYSADAKVDVSGSSTRIENMDGESTLTTEA